MTWLNPWITCVGKVSRVRVSPPSLPLGPCTTRFRVDGHAVYYRGKPVLLCDDDRAIVVGWRHKGELMACFLAVPDLGWFFRPYSAKVDRVLGVLLLVLATLLMVGLSFPLGLLLAGASYMNLAYAFAWGDGARLMRNILLGELTACGPDR